MQLGMIGLGRMGGNIVRRLLRDGHTAVVYDRDSKAIEALTAEGATAAESLEDLVAKLQAPRTAWVMLPAGQITEVTVTALGGLMAADDCIIDGGNSFYQDDVRRAQDLDRRGIHYVDVGTSGGVWGLERGYCMMIGGHKEAVDRLDPIFRTLAPGLGDIPRTPGREERDPRAEQGYIHAGPSGAGHFVKMVHNGIEYGLMQAYAEGFDILRHANAPEIPEARRFDLNLVSSWLLDLTAAALAGDERLEGYSGFVEDSGEGRWTINAAIEEAVPATVLSSALYRRFRSREDESYADKLLSAMRKGFGGHLEPPRRGPTP